MTPFSKTSLWRTGHLQTLAGSFPMGAKPRDFAAAREEILTIPTSDGFALRGVAWWQPGLTRRTVLLVHGFGGSHDSHYLLRIAVACYRAGQSVVRLSMRGARDGGILGGSIYHAGMGEDIQAATEWLLGHPKIDDLHIVGCSLGGCVTLSALCAWGDKAPKRLVAATSVSAPLDLARSCEVIDSPKARPYLWYLLWRVLPNFAEFQKNFPQKLPSISGEEIQKIRSIRELDDKCTVPLHGFANSDDYYTRCSTAPKLAQIRVPTLILHAEDDPMVPPRYERTESPYLHWELSPGGGHVGYIARPQDLWSGESFLAQRAIAFAEQQG